MLAQSLTAPKRQHWGSHPAFLTHALNHSETESIFLKRISGVVCVYLFGFFFVKAPD